MILSASGWRKVFAASGDAEDNGSAIGNTNRVLCALIGETFADYMLDRCGGRAKIAVAMDTRPTGPEIADVILRVLLGKGIEVQWIGVASAPEIMAYAKSLDGFLYISASHNPIGHNGIKFGLDDGGVLPGEETAKLTESFCEKCASDDAEEHADCLIDACPEGELRLTYMMSDQKKREALWAYEDTMRTIIAGTSNSKDQDKIFDAIRHEVSHKPLSVVCDMNGSSRVLSIDRTFIPGMGITFMPFNNEAGHIAHAIIPEPENLVWCADIIQDLQTDGESAALLGYMPDCDGDRGNIVYWNHLEQKALPIAAQEVFALCVVAESAFDLWKAENLEHKGLLWKAQTKYGKKAVVVNCSTSMRIDDICSDFGISVFRAEVGEANVVNLARKKREEGYAVRILGEGSNGGNITHPSCVRDPVATLFAMVKLLCIRDSRRIDGSISKGVFHLWCEISGQEYKYRNNFTFADIMDTLPEYTTTGVSEQRAVLQVGTEDKGLLKEKFRAVFMEEWASHREEMESIYGIVSYKAFITNGTCEKDAGNYWNNGNGGLKIMFYGKDDSPLAYIWMRPSGTEPVFRVLCDAKGDAKAMEAALLRWETSMLRKADERA